MRIQALNTIRRYFKRHITDDPDRFLKNVSGVIHIGANVGQERDLYAKYGLDVIWVEPIPEVFNQLVTNIADYPKQKALRYLVTDHDDGEYTFHVSSNNGASSSILDFKYHKDIWPTISYTNDITLHSVTLTKLISIEGIDISTYQALVMDTQGTELLILRGAEEIVTGFKYIKTEVPDFEAYEGCCMLDELTGFLNQHGFREFSHKEFAERKAGGCYYDVVYKRVEPNRCT